ncbi:MAG: nucleotidyltransferase family protein [Erythrobacter sp.]
MIPPQTQPGLPEQTGQAVDFYLASCVRAALAGEAIPPWPLAGSGAIAIPADDFSQIIIERAEFHGIGLLLAEHRLEKYNWPQPVIRKLEQLARLSGLWEELHVPKIADVIEALAEQGIPSIVLKGSALAYLHYADPAMRRRGDTDLLVHPEDLAQTRACLRKLRWISPDAARGLYFQESWDIDCGLGMLHTLDLHWHPADRPVIQKVLRPEGYWSGMRPLPRLSPNAAAPDRVTMLVHASINQFWHETRGYLVEDNRVVGGRRLIWAVDYHHMIASFAPEDWEQLATICAERDIGGIVHAVLAGAHRDIGLALPSGFPDCLLPTSGRSSVMEYIRSFDRIKDMRADLLAAESMATRIKLLSAALFAPREQLVKRFPDQAR